MRPNPLVAATLAALAIATALPAQSPSLSGVLLVSWGDPSPDLGGEPELDLHLALDDGSTVDLEIQPATLAAAGGLSRLNGQQVELGLLPDQDPAAAGRVTVTSVRRLPDPTEELDRPASRAVLGAKPWVSILCKFADEAGEPKNQAFFQGMYGSAPGGLDHYWREVSYDAINVVGSVAVDWVTLPSPRSTYVGSSLNHTLLFNDCTAAADSLVDFSNNGTGGFEGINMMFNASLGCCAWGGTRWGTLDGVTKLWRVTWEPPWGYADEGVIGHEMGHGFGLPHSNNWDGDSSPYDSPWDVMSAAVGFSVTDPTYGRLGKHTIAYHKNLLGWIPAGAIFDPPGPGIYSLTLDHLALAATGNSRLLRVPIGATGSSYFAEVREQQGNYDGAVPGNAVLIFEIDPTRQEPAWLVDADVPPANYSSNEGSMWKVGETFEDLANEIRISVDGPSPEGFDVTLYLGTAPTLETAPGSLGFGSVPIVATSSAILTLENNSTGPETVLIGGMALSDPLSFSLDPAAGSAPCGSTMPTLPAAGSCTVGVTFAPDSIRGYSEQLTIQSNAETPDLSVALTGAGSACTLPMDLTLTGSESGTVTSEACLTITAGPYQLIAPADVILRAQSVILQEAFNVQPAAEIAIENWP